METILEQAKKDATLFGIDRSLYWLVHGGREQGHSGKARTPRSNGSKLDRS